MSVSIDEAKDHDKALEFLRAKGATFPNYRLDEEEEVWRAKWKFKGPPAVLVFDRQGQQVKQFDNDDPDNQFTYEDVEKLVRELLKAK